jgi:hypothetical protein
LESLKIPHGKLLYLIYPSFFELFSKTKLTDFHLLEQNLLKHNLHKALLYEFHHLEILLNQQDNSSHQILLTLFYLLLEVVLKIGDHLNLK